MRKAELAHSHPLAAEEKGLPPFAEYPADIRNAVTALTGFDKAFIKNWSAATFGQITDTIDRLENLQKEQLPTTLEDYDELVGATLLTETNPIIQDLITQARRDP